MNARMVKKLRQLAHKAARQPMQAMRQAEAAHLTRLQQLAHVPLRPAPPGVPAKLWDTVQHWVVGDQAWALLNVQPVAVKKVDT